MVAYNVHHSGHRMYKRICVSTYSHQYCMNIFYWSSVWWRDDYLEKKLATIENCSATSSTPANNKQNAAADTNDGQTEPQSSPVVSVQQIQFTFYWSSTIVPCFLVVVVNNAIITTSQPSRQLQRQHKKRKTKIPEWNTNKETYDLRSILQISSDFILKTNTIQQNKTKRCYRCCWLLRCKSHNVGN